MLDVLKTYLSPARVGAPAAPRGKAAINNASYSKPRQHVRHLILLFVIFKAILLIAAALSPGLGYDTSTDLLFKTRADSSTPPSSWTAQRIEPFILRLARWECIYYASIAECGYVHEQEWAFGGAMGRAPVPLARVFISHLSLSPIVAHALASTVLSHIFHLGAVIALFSLTTNLLPETNEEGERSSIAFTAAYLHIISPGGLFLSAAYVESTFAFWTFAGMAIYVSATRHRMASYSDSIPCPISAGAILGLAAATRSNGLFNGIIPAWDAIMLLLSLARSSFSSRPLSSLITTVISGSLIGLGFVGPQLMAYIEYCIPTEGADSSAAIPRPWCSHIPPSIYQWVQQHYWNVGLFKYWTPNNIPLFALAAPMLALLLYTAAQVLLRPGDIFDLLTTQNATSADSKSPSSSMSTSSSSSPALKASQDLDRKVWFHCLPRLVIPQLLLAGVTLSTSHVQIVNRLSSAYPVWYILLAVAIHRMGGGGGGGIALGWLRRGSRAEWIARSMVLYAVVQGGLFASFLPPA